MKETETGTIFAIQNFSLDDGPGIRTAVFLKGCGMSCIWCHNPESISGARELMFREEGCLFCGACYEVCPMGAHSISGGVHAVDRALCNACGACAEACPSGLLTIAGYNASCAEIVAEAQKDMRYFRSSGGGLTITGGEPMFQPGFTLAIAKRARKAGISVALETNALAPFEHYEKLLPYTDLFLIDYKLTDDKAHTACTGVSNKNVLKNIEGLNYAGAKMVLRCPIIPEINDNDTHLRAIAELTIKYPGILGYELMPYHKLGTSKAKRMGVTPPVFKEPDEASIAAWKAKISEYGGTEYKRV